MIKFVRGACLYALILLCADGSIHIARAADASPALNVTAIFPDVSLPDADGTYSFTVRGTGFSSDPHLDENKIVFTDKETLCGNPLQKPPNPLCKLEVMQLTFGELRFSKIPRDYAGLRTVQFQVNGGALSPSPGKKISFAVIGAGWTRVMAIAIALVLLLIVWALLSTYNRTLPGGETMSLLYAALIDPATYTYSLGKLQFYIWLAAGLTSYIYLSVAKSLVQGSLVMGDVPSNLPMIAGIAVGTSVLSVGVSSLAGTPGSGEYRPSWSDLITSGGVVAPERLQFLLWNIVGGLSFLFYTFLIGPQSIQELPAIPETLVQIMGVSSAGYIAGKIARGPGPVIKSLVASNISAAAMTLDIRGTTLGTEGATFFLAERPNGKDIQVVPTIDKTNSGTIDPKGYATKLIMTIPAQPQLVIAQNKQYRFTLANPDGEKSVWEFST